MTGDWRREADDEWLDAHRSANFERLRRRLRLLGGMAEAMSNAELGPLGGAPRRPRLKIGGRTYAVVRYTTHHIAYTTIQVDPGLCRRCGQQLVEVHRIVYARGADARLTVGTVRTCRRCQADSWMFLSRMPSVNRARRVARKIVL
ncbi:MAG: hypothetical protein AUI10_09505 [Actinobacteria bacterium 13_2_20CM_2_72_6]|nr:MAG: hypothetical protein AUI10_09505 [Actinobacteria bacterium 13_2_20CM_2_72_6]